MRVGRVEKRPRSARKTYSKRREDEALEGAVEHFYTWQAMRPGPVERRSLSALFRSVSDLEIALGAIGANSELADLFRQRVPELGDGSSLRGLLQVLRTVLIEVGCESKKGRPVDLTARYWICCAADTWCKSGLGTPSASESGRFFKALQRFKRAPCAVSAYLLGDGLHNLAKVQEEMSAIIALPLPTPLDWRPFEDAVEDHWQDYQRDPHNEGGGK